MGFRDCRALGLYGGGGGVAVDDPPGSPGISPKKIHASPKP